MKDIASDPLDLIAVESGHVRAPLADAAAQGNSQLDVAQRAAVIGEPVPIVFCRRESGRGGVLISPPATECRFENDEDNRVTASYHLVLGEGRIGSIQVRDVFQRSCRVGTFTQTYDRRAGTWEPGNFIEDQSRPWRLFFLYAEPGTYFSISGNIGIDNANAFDKAKLTDPDQLDDYPFNVYDDFCTWYEATLLRPSIPEEQTAWDYGGRFPPVEEKYIRGRDYPIPEASFHCGSIGVYSGMSTMSFQVTTPNGSDQWNRQVHCFIRRGMEVDRLVEEDNDSSNNYADLVRWSLLNCSGLPADLIDTDQLAETAAFLKEYNFNCDIYIKDSENLADFLAKLSPYFLVTETRNNGKCGLRPLLPLNNDHTIKTTAVSSVFTFTEDHIDPGSFELSYIPRADRRPFCVQALWRQQFDDDFGIIRSSEVRYAETALNGPYEQHDLSKFCTYEDHAVKVAAYILARRRHISHTLRIALTGVNLSNVTLTPGKIVRVTLQRDTFGEGASVHDYLYEISRITQSLSGLTQLELTHFPVNAEGASLVALDVASAEGSGILLEKNSDGVSCDVNDANDTSVPDEEYIEGEYLDFGSWLIEPEEEEEEEEEEGPKPTIAALRFYSIEWDSTTLIISVRVTPTGLAPVEGAGDLVATIESGTVVAVDENGVAVSPQPAGLPSLNTTGIIVAEWTAENYPDDNTAIPPPGGRIFQGEFQVEFSISDFPPLDEENYVEYRMPISITSTTGGFDQVTILNDALAVFEPKTQSLHPDAIFYYDFADENCYPGTGATVTDLGPLANHGTIYGSGIEFSGTAGGSMQYDGLNPATIFVPVPPGTFNLNDDNGPVAYSYVAWIYIQEVEGGADYQTIVNFGDDNLWIGTYSWWNPGRGLCSFSPNFEFESLGFNQWYQVAFCYESSGTYDIYLNGSQVFSYETTGGAGDFSSSDNAFSIGSGTSGNPLDVAEDGSFDFNESWQGYIGLIAAYGVKLSSAQVADMYSQTAGRFT